MAVPRIPTSPTAPPYNPANGLDIIGAGPAQDPQYLAFLRASGATEAEARATTLAKQEALDRALQAQLPTFAAQLQSQLGATAQANLANGTYQSGGRLYQQALDQQANARQVGAAQQTDLEGKASLESDLASQIAKEREAQAEQGLTARSNVALGSNAAVNGLTSNPTAGSGRLAGNSNLTGV